MSRSVIFFLPRFLALPPNTLFRVESSFFNLTITGLQWFSAYNRRHIASFLLVYAAYDRCLTYIPLLLYRNKRVKAIVCLQANNMLYGGKVAFKDRKQRSEKRLLRKPSQTLESHTSFNFNGALLKRTKMNDLLQKPNTQIPYLRIERWIRDNVKLAVARFRWRSVTPWSSDSTYFILTQAHDAGSKTYLSY